MTTKYVLTIYSGDETDHYTFESDTSRYDLEKYLLMVFIKSDWKEIVIETNRIRRIRDSKYGYSYDLHTLEEWFQHKLIQKD